MVFKKKSTSSPEPKAKALKNPYDLPEIQKRVDATEMYWMGTLTTCPRWLVEVNGMSFPRYIDPPVESEKGQTDTKRAFGRGIVLPVSNLKAAAVLEGLKNKIVRFRDAAKKSGNFFNRDSKNYVPQPGDEPLAMHVYFVRAGDREMFMRSTINGGYPKSVYEAHGGTTISAATEVADDGPVPEFGEGIDDVETEGKYKLELKGKKSEE
ncbi:hypothetical protein [uncultured Mediterranean phage]|nr:hypothetical protein [uncultured Mediterranean phage]